MKIYLVKINTAYSNDEVFHMADTQKRVTQQERPVTKQSASKNASRRRKFMIGIKWVKIIIIILGVIALTRTGYEWYQILQQQKALQVQIEELKKKNEQLEQENAQLQDPKAIESGAREELGLVKPGEVPYVK